MKNKQAQIDRRNFLKAIGAAGLSSAFSSGHATAQPGDPNNSATADAPKLPQVPKRKLGRLTRLDESGRQVPLEVPCLSFGTFQVDTENQILLRKTLEWGINYWDTAYNYSGGNSELGIGKFLARNPGIRKDLFIADKASKTTTIADMEDRLQTSLKRMNTDYIDLYYLHELEQIDRLNNDLRDWAKSAKDRGLIRFFGFTVHRDMTICLNVGVKLDWIDAIMLRYNFRDMQDEDLNAAIDACYKRGIGLTAIKVMGKGQVKEIETEGDKKLTEHFLRRGFTEGQAKIKAVLTDERISSVCVGMKNIALLTSNVAAVFDKTEFTPEDMKVFRKVARQTCSGYCAGCAHICDAALPDMPYVSDVMRYLMYHNSYGEKELARRLFAELPAQARKKLVLTDYSQAEARCPQHLPIAALMAEAEKKLA
ncbi:MAG TPA: aldo/keto reductase [Sedimentisphaerales bacterium]|nr:aldo/keto reductase [Sedimentisphaerales bacterium]